MKNTKTKSFTEKSYLISKAKNIVFKKRKGAERDFECYWDNNKLTNRLEIEVNRLHSLSIYRLMSRYDLMVELRKLILYNFPIGSIDEEIVKYIKTKSTKVMYFKFRRLLENYMDDNLRLDIKKVKVLIQVMEIIKGK